MDEREQQLKRFRELATRAKYIHRPVFTRFLEMPAEIPVRTCANEADVNVYFYGGYDDAERRMACFSVDKPEDADYPISTLAIRWNPKYASPGHRDLLGSLMGLGVERDVLGDIAFSNEDGLAYLFVCDDIADYLSANLESVGRTHVKAEPHIGSVQIRESEGVTLRITVAAVRLDSLLAGAYKLSRSEAQKLIEGGFVRRNYAPELRSDVLTAEKDLISVRGYGRMRILTIDDKPTRKGRLVVHVFKYT